MSVNLELEGGAQAEALRLEGGRLHLTSPQAFAPGTPVHLTLRSADGDAVIEGRSQGSKRRPDGRFDVRLRLVNLTRALRERLSQTLDPDRP